MSRCEHALGRTLGLRGGLESLKPRREVLGAVLMGVVVDLEVVQVGLKAADILDMGSCKLIGNDLAFTWLVG